MAALEALLPEELERHCQFQRSRLDTYQKLREEVVLYAEGRGYVAPSLVKSQRLERTEMIPWLLEDLDQGKGDLLSRARGRNPIGKGRGAGKCGATSSGQANAQKIQGQCWNCGKTGLRLKDCWARSQQQQSQGESKRKGSDLIGKSGKGEGKKGNQQTGS